MTEVIASNKQIQYPTFIARIFSTTVDLFVLAVVTMPFSGYLNNWLLVWNFKDYLLSKNTNLSDPNAVQQALMSTDFYQSVGFEGIMRQAFTGWCLQISIFALYFLTCWIYNNATPGKFVIRSKIVDAKTMGIPTKWQYVKRFFGMFLSFIGVWFIIFDKRKQALHDKIAGTLVIKK